MKKLLFLVIIFCGGLFFSTMQAQEKKVIKSKAEKVEKTRGEHPYIKMKKPVDDSNPMPEPKEQESRASYCKVWIDNYTGYGIDIYIDGYYKGTLPPWEKQYTWAIAGKTSIYCETVGGTLYWGPKYFSCEYEYTWELGR